MEEKKEKIGVYSICNSASLNIYDIKYDIEDSVLVGINNEEPEWHELIVEMNDEKVNDEDDVYRFYFIYGGERFYLDEFMRV